MLCRIRFGLVAVLLLVLAASSRAQTPTPTPAPVQMALSSPFAQSQKPLLIKGRAGKWVPLAITLSNTGEPVAGQVELQLAPNQGGTFNFASNTFSTQVDLPTNSSKRIWLYARLDRPDVGGFNVSFSGRGFPALSQSAQVRQPDPEQREVMVVSDSDIGLSDTLRALRSQALFRGGKMPTNNTASGVTPVLPFSFSKELVPDRWIGFESADMVVLGDFAHIALSPTQISALRGYVVGGGTLVVMGGANAARLSSSPLKDLWPMSPTTSVSASKSEVAGLVAKYVDHVQNGADRLGGAPVVVTRGQLSPDVALPREGTPAQPLYSIRQSGAGRVVFLSYDPSQPPFKGWSGQANLWADLFQQASKVRTLETVDAGFLSSSSYANFGGSSGYVPPPSYSGQDEEAGSSLTGRLLQALSHAEQLRMPPVSQIAWFLALYVFFLVPLNYAVLRIIDRRELAWVTIPVIVTAFSVWAYTEALSIRGRAILTRQMDIVQSSLGSKAGRVDSLFWLFSPRRTNYDISTGGQNAALCDYATQAGGEQGNFSVSQPLDGGSFKIEGAPLRMWTDRAFASQSLGDLKAGLALNGNKLSNGIGLDLYGAVWVQDGRVTGLGALPSGGSLALSPNAKSQKFGADVSGAIVRASKLDAVFDQSSRANGIPQAALSAALGEGFGKFNGQAMLLAWGRESVAPFSIGSDNGQGRKMTLFIFRAPKLPALLASREATISPVTFQPFSPGQSPAQGGFALYNCEVPTSSGSLTIRAHGVGATNRLSDSLSYNRRFGRVPAAAVARMAPKKMVRFEAWNVERTQWEAVPGKLQIDASPAGGWNFSAPIPSRWIRRPDNTLRMRVRLANAGTRISSFSIEK